MISAVATGTPDPLIAGIGASSPSTGSGFAASLLAALAAPAVGAAAPTDMPIDVPTVVQFDVPTDVATDSPVALAADPLAAVAASLPAVVAPDVAPIPTPDAVVAPVVEPAVLDAAVALTASSGVPTPLASSTASTASTVDAAAIDATATHAAVAEPLSPDTPTASEVLPSAPESSSAVAPASMPDVADVDAPPTPVAPGVPQHVEDASPLGRRDLDASPTIDEERDCTSPRAAGDSPDSCVDDSVARHRPMMQPSAANLADLAAATATVPATVPLAVRRPSVSRNLERRSAGYRPVAIVVPAPAELHTAAAHETSLRSALPTAEAALPGAAATVPATPTSPVAAPTRERVEQPVVGVPADATPAPALTARPVDVPRDLVKVRRAPSNTADGAVGDVVPTPATPTSGVASVASNSVPHPPVAGRVPNDAAVPTGLGMHHSERVLRAKAQASSSPLQRLSLDLDDAKVAVRFRGAEVSVDVVSDPHGVIEAGWTQQVERTLGQNIRAQEPTPRDASSNSRQGTGTPQERSGTPQREQQRRDDARRFRDLWEQEELA